MPTPKDVFAKEPLVIDAISRVVEIVIEGPVPAPVKKAYIRKEHLEQRPFRNKEMAQFRSTLIVKDKRSTFKNRKR